MSAPNSFSFIDKVIIWNATINLKKGRKNVNQRYSSFSTSVGQFHESEVISKNVMICIFV